MCFAKLYMWQCSMCVCKIVRPLIQAAIRQETVWSSWRISLLIRTSTLNPEIQCLCFQRITFQFGSLSVYDKENQFSSLCMQCAPSIEAGAVKPNWEREKLREVWEREVVRLIFCKVQLYPWGSRMKGCLTTILTGCHTTVERRHLICLPLMAIIVELLTKIFWNVQFHPLGSRM